MCVCIELTMVGEGSSGPQLGLEGRGGAGNWLQAKLGYEQLNRKSVQSCTLHVCMYVCVYIHIERDVCVCVMEYYLGIKSK